MPRKETATSAPSPRRAFWMLHLSVVLGLLCFPRLGLCQTQAEFTYITNNSAITITGVYFPITFQGPSGPITIPSMINGLPVTSLAETFSDVFGLYLTSITIPSTVTNIRDFAFEDDLFLTNITFEGNAPTVGWGAIN